MVVVTAADAFLIRLISRTFGSVVFWSQRVIWVRGLGHGNSKGKWDATRAFAA